MPASPVREVDFGTALKISLDNYYDLLKTTIGGLGAQEFLQLKLVADTVDISDKPWDQQGYRWFSYYAIDWRADLQIEPEPVSGTVLTGAERLSSTYGKFLQVLQKYAVLRDLTPAEQIQVADYDKTIASLKDDALELSYIDREKWAIYCQRTGTSLGDRAHYLQWSNSYGNIRRIQELINDIKITTFRKKQILDRKYKDPADREIVEAVFDFENPLQRLRYPTYPDYVYAEGASFSPTYLASLPPGSTAIFDDRYVVNPDKTLGTIKTTSAGAFNGKLSSATAESHSITTDWSAGGSASYGFIRVSASTSEHTSIQTDFRKGKEIEIRAKAAFRVNLIYPAWFKPTLFDSKRVTENITDFAEFFGPDGSLLYYPTAMVLIRGFAVKFESTQKWQYNYERKFSASGGGGFNAFGVNFGAKGNYSSHETEHKVDQSNTSLEISDGEETLRFVGYVVKKTDVMAATLGKILKGPPGA
ncbi:hypothetical protein ACQZ5G_14825 [Agrobacterium sp. 22-214-1]